MSYIFGEDQDQQEEEEFLTNDNYKEPWRLKEETWSAPFEFKKKTVDQIKETNKNKRNKDSENLFK